MASREVFQQLIFCISLCISFGCFTATTTVLGNGGYPGTGNSSGGHTGNHAGGGFDTSGGHPGIGHPSSGGSSGDSSTPQTSNPGGGPHSGHPGGTSNHGHGPGGSTHTGNPSSNPDHHDNPSPPSPSGNSTQGGNSNSSQSETTGSDGSAPPIATQRMSDSRGCIIHEMHQKQILESESKIEQMMKKDPRISQLVQSLTQEYWKKYRKHTKRRFIKCDRFWRKGRTRYHHWWGHGFTGGYWWAFNPFYDIHLYFWSPTVHWLYSERINDYFNSKWYGAHYSQYPALHQPFRQPGVFYPTEEFANLNLAVSSFPPEAQSHYRVGIQLLVDHLNFILRARQGGRVHLKRNHLIVNHFQVLPENRGIVLEGLVANTYRQFPFKAFLDLVSPKESLVFAPKKSDHLDVGQLQELRDLNTRISNLGGIIEGGAEVQNFFNQ